MTISFASLHRERFIEEVKALIASGDIPLKLVEQWIEELDHTIDDVMDITVEMMIPLRLQGDTLYRCEVAFLDGQKAEREWTRYEVMRFVPVPKEDVS